MNEYVNLELKNDIKDIVIDAFYYQDKEYFLLAPDSSNEPLINNLFNICIYNKEKNCFERISDEKESEFISLAFEKRLKNKKKIEFAVENISFEKMEKLKIININNYDYTLQKSTGEIIIKNIEFYKRKPKVNDYIFMSSKTLKEDMLQYGLINNLENIKETEIIKVINENEKYLLQRYYG